MKSRVSHSSKIVRSGKVALLAAALMATGILSAAQAQNASVFKGIRIDVSGMPPGAGFARNQMQACLSRYVPAAFAGRINPGARNAPLLVVRPFTLTLTDSSNNDDGGGSGGSDTMEGEAIVGATRIPLMVAAAPQITGPAFAEAAARQRMDALCNNFAYWLARQI